jgi:hypothetical protein
MTDELLDMSLNHIQIANPVSCEDGSDHLSAVMPLLAVRREYAITQELLPLFMELRSLAKAVELGRQKSLDVLWFGRENDAEVRENSQLRGVVSNCRTSAMIEDPFPVFERYIGTDTLHGVIQEFDT